MDNTELDLAVREAARKANIGALLAGAGITAVALNRDGQLTRYHPDGSTSTIPQHCNGSQSDGKPLTPGHTLG